MPEELTPLPDALVQCVGGAVGEELRGRPRGEHQAQYGGFVAQLRPVVLDECGIGREGGGHRLPGRQGRRGTAEVGVGAGVGAGTEARARAGARVGTGAGEPVGEQHLQPALPGPEVVDVSVWVRPEGLVVERQAPQLVPNGAEFGGDGRDPGLGAVGQYRAVAGHGLRDDGLAPQDGVRQELQQLRAGLEAGGGEQDDDEGVQSAEEGPCVGQALDLGGGGEDLDQVGVLDVELLPHQGGGLAEPPGFEAEHPEAEQ
ncbi:hypothetical protein [Kitasatospora sp. NPDC059827]|uniref:hypothetical protein n=1 Tax=Kitasatospora sp. NPDC059827 TaxID=3346964 RepID=UPI0036651FBD